MKYLLYKKFILLVFITVCLMTAFSGMAQKMSIESFELLEKDLTALNEKTSRIDSYNGGKCALIKVETTEHNFAFDFGVLAYEEKEDQNSKHPGEIWIYVPEGVKKISIQHPQLGSINDYDLGQTLKKAKTYRLKLTTDQVNTVVIDYGHSQYIKFKIDPKNAELYINGLKQPVNTNGICEIPLPFGTHTYRVTAKDYHHEDGHITISDKDKRQELEVNLKPAYGLLTISGGEELKDGEVYVDGTLLGVMPLNQKPVGSGTHNLRIIKKLYKPYEQTFTISDNQILNLTPKMNPDYVSIDISVPQDRDAEIYDNGAFLAKGKWSGRLESGKHKIEARKEHYVSTIKEVELRNGQNEVISLAPPQPIVGTLRVSSTPDNAEVWLDGNRVGVTPYYNTNLIEGQHYLELKKVGCMSEKKTIMISQHQPTVENIRLSDYCRAVISSIPSAFLYIDGKYMGKTPYNLYQMAGKYKIKLMAYGYTTYEKTLQLDGTTKDFNVKLLRNYTRPKEFYLQFGYEYLGNNNLNAGLGGYLNNINIEANFILGISKSENIYWYDPMGPGYTDGPENYTPLGANVKVGYGFRIGGRFRITPQLGTQFLTLKNNGYGTAENSWVTSGWAGIRLHIALLHCLGIAVTPEYRIKIKSSAGFEALSSVSKSIKQLGNGIGGNACLTLYF